MRAKDKVTLITGAASGIGRATAILFAKEGAILYICDINYDKLKETANLIGDNNNKIKIKKVDVTKFDEVKNWVDEAVKNEGRIDNLIVNAGVVRVGQIEDFSDKDYDLLINVNLKGTFYTCKAAVPYFKKQKFGSIVNLASVAAHIGQFNHANYCSTKAGVLGFTRALALDLAPYNVRVNSVSPGATDTPMLQSDVAKEAKQRGISYEEVKKEFEAQGVLGRWAKPEEIAAGILFLTTNEASYITGADLRIDGGWTTR
ncbi:MAG: SDR family NAD(P)-dependent oxidoreductase [Promethearchaeota archaeon]